MKRIGGWWRLWLVCSGLWFVLVVGTGVLYWPKELPTVYPLHSDKLNQESRDLLLPLPDKVGPSFFDQPAPNAIMAPDDEEGPWKEFQKKKLELRGYKVLPPLPPGATLLDTVSVSMFFFAPDGQEFKLPSKTTKAQVDSLRTDYKRVQKAILTSMRLQHTFWTLFMWVVPCAIVALLGLAFRWVFRGFKKEEAIP